MGSAEYTEPYRGGLQSTEPTAEMLKGRKAFICDLKLHAVFLPTWSKLPAAPHHRHPPSKLVHVIVTYIKRKAVLHRARATRTLACRSALLSQNKSHLIVSSVVHEVMPRNYYGIYSIINKEKLRVVIFSR